MLCAAPAQARTFGTGATNLASAFDFANKNPFDFRFSVGWRRRLRRGAIVRELTGRNTDQQSREHVKELRYSQAIHTLNLRADVGLWHDLQLHLTIPIILADTRTLSFAQNGGDSCGSPPWTNCVTPRNSTTVRDGLLDASQMPLDQVVVAGPDGAPGGRTLPVRRGLDQIHFGLSWAPLSQARDDTKPTWAIGFEARIAAGSTMAYDPNNPTKNTSVSRGLHQMHWWTAVSKRYTYVDAWVGFHYFMPIARDNSLFQQTTFNGSGQERHEPRHRGWIEAGAEIIPWEQPKKKNRFSIEIALRLEGVFEGRGYSPMWELFSGQPNLSRDCINDRSTGAPSTWNNGTYCRAAGARIPYPGITRIENHLNFFGKIALNLQLTEYFQARFLLGIGHEQSHDITFADAGRAFCDPNNPDGCRGQIQLDDPRQVNPMYRPLIDAPGRRYRVAEATIFDIGFSLRALF